jgi:cytidine deaminase
MNYLPEEKATNLMTEARLACERTYSPYSHFPVGAALLAGNGEIFTGANIENASYGLTICAERVAIGNCFTAGRHDIIAIAVYTPSMPVAPCGACRQFIIEFGKDIIVVFREGNEVVQKTIGELLPYSFSF